MDYSRQLEMMDVHKIKKNTITIIGVGATGSHVATLLTQMGWGDENRDQGVLNLWDFDKIEWHNLSNQMFEPSQIGMNKVDAINELVARKCGFKVRVFNEKVTNQTIGVQSTYVFLLTDTMASRKEIFDNCLKYSFNTQLVIETRMGLNEGRVYSFNPSNRDHVREWEASLYSDKEAEKSLCGTSRSIVTTAMFIASLATTRVIQHFNDIPSMWNEMHFKLCPEAFYYRRFGENPNFLPEVL
jgi:molybdopterin/thiamine biosynthesis adenylyltransferase